ncbi:MAG: hypothetical protein ACRD2L_14740 [Terriglobia bacterium]
MKKHTTKKRSRTNWARIEALTDREIDFSDIPEFGKAFSNALYSGFPSLKPPSRFDWIVRS